MKNLVRLKLFLLVVFITSSYSLLASTNEELKKTKLSDNKTEYAKKDKVLYQIDFTSAAKQNTNAREWMSKKGFEFKSDADSKRYLNLSFKNDALNLKAKSGIFGFMPKVLDVNGASKIKIVWGVNKFPEGASYKKGINNEAIMLYVYFGKEKLSSGNFFIPGSPYFLGLFLGENEDIGKPRIGNHFKEGGRFICLAMPKAGETVTSVFNLSNGFKDSFGKNKDVPYISGIALEIETSSTSATDSFIKKIEFLR
jgi:hypothetical protein